jgi:hypothetical protein
VAWGDCTVRYVTQPSVYNRPIAEGEWVSPTAFQLKMQMTCGSQALSGTYAFDLATMTAKRIGP